MVERLSRRIRPVIQLLFASACSDAATADVQRRHLKKVLRQVGRTAVKIRFPERFKLKRSHRASKHDSPSPRPSPAGRGRIASSRLKMGAARFARRSWENAEAHDGCSLSQRERVRVRENATAQFTCGHRFFGNDPMPVPAVLSNVTTIKGPERPGRGKIGAATFRNS